MNRINDIISYIPASEEPLSSDVGIISTKNGVWLCDVGNCRSALDEINAIKAKKTVVLTHFHPDHIGNLDGVTCADRLFVGDNTFRYTNRGTVVKEDIFINDGGVEFHIFPLPSSHAKGSLGLEINGEYAFLGDGIYPCEKSGLKTLNVQLLREQTEKLESLKAKYFILSHQRNVVTEKAAVSELLHSHYLLRTKDSPYIFL